ncbi:hypothetical protein [Labrenzia sp. 011]|uniref:hypothetical protein n=1 Tax=Labrenzia sp. 011 TaxID=2171494 RepID=UPI000D518DDB|nr:hypothetical protein [Labrenzia sp. 011]PVB59778.1 hypothetical protein DCO57_20480 [Labrenzia sp. 011]
MFRTTIASVMLFAAFAAASTVNAATHSQMQVKPAAQTVSAKATEGARIVVAGRTQNRRVEIRRRSGGK